MLGLKEAGLLLLNAWTHTKVAFWVGYDPGERGN